MKHWSLFFLLLFLSVLGVGCSTLPSNYVRVLPPPVTNFPEAPRIIVRIPVSFVFPKDVGKHFFDLFKDVLRPKRDEDQTPKSLKDRLHMLEIWRRLQEPIYLDRDIWLLIHPATLSWGSAQNDPGDILNSTAILETSAKPEVIFGPKPHIKTVEMPSIGVFKPGPINFSAISNIHSGYAEATEHLNDPRLKLVRQYITGTGMSKVMIDHIRLYGSGGKVIVEAKIQYQPLVVNLGTRPAHLTLYFRGTPRYRPKEQVFDLPDLEYDVQTSDLMIQVADRVFKEEIRDRLRRAIQLEMKGRMDVLRAKMNKALNCPLGPFIRLSSQMTSFQVLDGFADNEGIEARVSLKGTIALKVTWN